MGRPRKAIALKRVRLSITLHPKLYNWIQENSGEAFDNKRFRSITDAVEQALILLKEKIESDK